MPLPRPSTIPNRTNHRLLAWGNDMTVYVGMTLARARLSCLDRVAHGRWMVGECRVRVCRLCLAHGWVGGGGKRPLRRRTHALFRTAGGCERKGRQGGRGRGAGPSGCNSAPVRGAPRAPSLLQAARRRRSEGGTSEPAWGGGGPRSGQECADGVCGSRRGEVERCVYVG